VSQGKPEAGLRIESKARAEVPSMVTDMKPSGAGKCKPPVSLLNGW
jgi:hypothetical protein